MPKSGMQRMDLIQRKKHGFDLYLRVNDNVFTEVSHCDIRQKSHFMVAIRTRRSNV